MLQREAVPLGAEPTAYFAPWVLLGVKIAARRERAHALFSWTNVRTLNEGAGFDPNRSLANRNPAAQQPLARCASFSLQSTEALAVKRRDFSRLAARLHGRSRGRCSGQFGFLGSQRLSR